MLDAFEILTTSGIVLWRKHSAADPLSPNIINSLINDVFIEERRSATAQTNGENPPYRKEKYVLKWTAAKELGLVFVVGKRLQRHIPIL
jgi:signal recognition particle receptor subunit alpha